MSPLRVHSLYQLLFCDMYKKAIFPGVMYHLNMSDHLKLSSGNVSDGGEEGRCRMLQPGLSVFLHERNL